MGEQRTYWHLEESPRKPSDYDIATSRLLYYCDPRARDAAKSTAGLEVSTPAAQWIERYREGSLLQASDWERFQDPRQTTYTLYTKLQCTQEAYVDGVFGSVDPMDYDKRLPAAWIRRLERLLPTLRFPLHGLQMVSAYIGHLAPSGRIAIAALLQTADEIRRIQRLAYRMRELQENWPGFGDSSRETWETDPLWQPLRALVEKLLVAYDWGESLVALNFCLKPAFDGLFIGRFARAAERAGDPHLARLLNAFEEDVRWHRDWSRALVNMAVDDHPPNVSAISQWQDKWRPAVNAALAPFADTIEP